MRRTSNLNSVLVVVVSLFGLAREAKAECTSVDVATDSGWYTHVHCSVAEVGTGGAGGGVHSVDYLWMLFFGSVHPTDPLPYVTGPEIGGHLPSFEQKVTMRNEAVINAIRILETNRNCFDMLSGSAAGNPLDLLKHLERTGRIVIGGPADGTIAQVMGPNGADQQALGASYDGSIHLFDHFFGIVNNRDYAVNSTTDQRTLTILHELGHLTAAPLVDGIWHWGPISANTFDTALAARCGLDTGF